LKFDIKDNFQISYIKAINIFNLNKKRKILIVDDNENLLRSLNKMLLNLFEKNQAEYEIISASDGLDILRYIIEDQFKGNLIKCVITDENMKFIKGSEAVKILSKLWKQKKIKHISFLLLLKYENDYRFSQYSDELTCEYLSKPFTINLLEMKMREIEIFDK